MLYSFRYILNKSTNHHLFIFGILLCIKRWLVSSNAHCT